MSGEPADPSTALVTGASAGIGAALAREFAAHGHDVVLVARREQRLQSLADELEAEGVTATPIVMDLDVAILVNNVGVGTYGPFAESDLDAERTQLRLNVVLPVELTRLLLDEGLGKVLNVGSVAGFQPGPQLSTYYASKAYVNSFSAAIAEELRGDVGDSTVGALTSNTPSAVAEAAYAGLLAGETVVIPSRMMRAVALLGRVMPRLVVRRVAGWVNSDR